MAAISADVLSSRPSSTAPEGTKPGRAAIWGGAAMTTLAALFLAFDAIGKLLGNEHALKATTELGYPAEIAFTLGVLQAICLALYLVPRTAVLGAVLWTGYLGGAIATHVRVDNPLLSHTLFPVYVAILVWGGLWLRDRRVRALLPVDRR